MNEDFYSAVVAHQAKTHSNAIFDDTANIVWIDWREEEDVIVDEIAAKIAMFPLSATVRDADNEAGYDVEVMCRNQRRIVNPDATFDSRHATLNAIDELVSPEYQIRFVTDTNGADTIGVAVELSSDWSRLHQRFGKRLNEHFCPIRELPDLMNTPGNEIDRVAREYASRNA